jgi:ribosome recycling factor
MSKGNLTMDSFKKYIEEQVKVFKASLSVPGRADPKLVSGLAVEGGRKIRELCSVCAISQKELEIRPFDSSSLKKIMNSVEKFGLGTVREQGSAMVLTLSAVTMDFLLKKMEVAKQILESCKSSIREFRHKLLKELKQNNPREDERKREEKEIQKLIDSSSETLDNELKNYSRLIGIK